MNEAQVQACSGKSSCLIAIEYNNGTRYHISVNDFVDNRSQNKRKHIFRLVPMETSQVPNADAPVSEHIDGMEVAAAASSGYSSDDARPISSSDAV